MKLSPTGSFLVRLLIYFLKNRTRGVVEIEDSYFFSPRAVQIRREMINMCLFFKHIFLARNLFLWKDIVICFFKTNQQKKPEPMDLISQGDQHGEDNPSVPSTANTALCVNHSSSIVRPGLQTLFHFNSKRIWQDPIL